MAHFIGFLNGRAKTQVSRLGTKSTGISARAQGWDIGGRIDCAHNPNIGPDGTDIISLYVTSGSNATTHELYIGSFRINPKTGKIEPCTNAGGA